MRKLILALSVLMLAFIIAGCGKQGRYAELKAQNGVVTIPESEVSDTNAHYYYVSVDGKDIKLVNISPKTAEIFYEGKKQVLQLEAAAALTQRAREVKKDEERPAGGPGVRLNQKKGGTGDANSSVTLPVGKK